HMNEAGGRRDAGCFLHVRLLPEELHDKVVDPYGKQRPLVRRSQFGQVDATLGLFPGKAAVSAVSRLVEALFDAEAARISVRVGPVRPAQKLAQHKLLQPFPPARAWRRAELHGLTATHHRSRLPVAEQSIEKALRPFC